jgi:hypothetical protein
MINKKHGTHGTLNFIVDMSWILMGGHHSKSCSNRYITHSQKRGVMSDFCYTYLCLANLPPLYPVCWDQPWKTVKELIVQHLRSSKEYGWMYNQWAANIVILCICSVLINFCMLSISGCRANCWKPKQNTYWSPTSNWPAEWMILSNNIVICREQFEQLVAWAALENLEEGNVDGLVVFMISHFQKPEQN